MPRRARPRPAGPVLARPSHACPGMPSLAAPCRNWPRHSMPALPCRAAPNRVRPRPACLATPYPAQPRLAVPCLPSPAIPRRTGPHPAAPCLPRHAEPRSAVPSRSMPRLPSHAKPGLPWSPEYLDRDLLGARCVSSRHRVVQACSEECRREHQKGYRKAVLALHAMRSRVRMSITGAVVSRSSACTARIAVTILRKSSVVQTGLRWFSFTAVTSLCGGLAVARA